MLLRSQIGNEIFVKLDQVRIDVQNSRIRFVDGLFQHVVPLQRLDDLENHFASYLHVQREQHARGKFLIGLNDGVERPATHSSVLTHTEPVVFPRGEGLTKQVLRSTVDTRPRRRACSGSDRTAPIVRTIHPWCSYSRCRTDRLRFFGAWIAGLPTISATVREMSRLMDDVKPTMLV